MIDTHPCATPMPAQPVATVTSTAALPPPPDPLPHAEGPAVPVTDPVSNLDFLPVDDAFALEMRAETIEQLAGGDALRRGESERIEAGRSQTNVELVSARSPKGVGSRLRKLLEACLVSERITAEDVLRIRRSGARPAPCGRSRHKSFRHTPTISLGFSAVPRVASHVVS